MAMVVFGLLGTVLDAGSRPERWRRWRPSVSLFQNEAREVARFELLVPDVKAPLVKTLLKDIALVSPETKVIVHELSLKNPWDFEEVYEALYDFSQVYKFQPSQEEYFLHITTGTHVAQICMFLLAEARYFPAKLLQTSPPKRVSNGEEPTSQGVVSEIDLDLSKYDRIAQRFAQTQMEATTFLKSGIKTRNQQFNELIAQLEKVAGATTSPVLLEGPSGSGKSKLARRLFELKKNRHQITGEFVEVNCATLKGINAMASLFGHKKGAFLGAPERSGLLASAHNGVLFLDEIASLGLDEQAMLLGALESGFFRPLGSDHEVQSEFQLIVGTHKDLLAEVAAGRFRQDLFVRINIWTYVLPSLRERLEDIEPNIDYELQKYSQETNSALRFNKEAKQAYLDFCLSEQALWSANFRDLSASVHRMATLAEKGRIRLDGVEHEIRRLIGLWHATVNNMAFDILSRYLSASSIEQLDLFEKYQLAGVLKQCIQEQSLSDAGRVLFSVSRLEKKTTNDADRISKYLAKYDLDWPLQPL